MQNGDAVPGRAELERAFATFTGMEGGNPAAAVWVCDAAPRHDVLPLPEALRPQRQPAAWDAAFRRFHADALPRWQTHGRVARVMAAARAATLPRGGLPVGPEEYFNRYLYAPGGWDFKLNLFPLPRRPQAGLPWGKVFRDQPALRSWPAYLDLCRDGGRFGFISALRMEHRPRVVLCLGEGHARDYLLAFGFQDVTGTDAILQPVDMARRRLQVFRHEETTLVLCPAFGGAQGMNSDVLLDALGAFLAQWLCVADFPPFLEAAAPPAVPRGAGAQNCPKNARAASMQNGATSVPW